jgi:hypothetical protein
MDPQAVREALHTLVDQYRIRCLWFLRADFYPETLAEQLQVLSLVERHGDADAFRRAKELRKWLSRPSNEASANSQHKDQSHPERAMWPAEPR